MFSDFPFIGKIGMRLDNRPREIRLRLGSGMLLELRVWVVCFGIPVAWKC